MILKKAHFTQEFSKHIDWIIEELKKDSTKNCYLELDWFDQPTIIDIKMAEKIRRAIHRGLYSQNDQ
ncbi:hypothetical protein [Enterococcus casseliflavus]|uniref:hypothetical protein n=1 Tax=Enterococcus casseliflavus TaxID=37734 RepID=UPI003D0CEE73